MSIRPPPAASTSAAVRWHQAAPGDLASLKMAIEIVSFPMKNGDFPMKNGDFNHSYVTNYHLG